MSLTNLKVPKVGFISLGCPKAGSDTEKILTRVKAEGYEIASNYSHSDLVIVNTCGFIDSAVEESLDAIGEAVKNNGNVIVTGCLGEKKDIIQKRFPKLLAITGSEAFDEVMDAVHQHVPKPHDPHIDLIPPQGMRLTPKHYAYIKISEGCNHTCSFCIIPTMRGMLKSRDIGDILNEAETLVKNGVTELIIISQDTSAYGVDIKYRTGFWNGRPIKSDLYNLAKHLGELGVWVRFHYIYPYPHVDNVINLMANGSILPYIDVPFQHASPKILKLMRRPANAENNLERIQRWREICPDITIRSTFIVGFPGESDDDFQALIDFIGSAELDHVGCFKYSNVEGASAKLMQDQISDDLKDQRYNLFMQAQQKVSRKKLASKINTTQTVIVDAVNNDFAEARSAANAPEIDGVIYLENPEGLEVGDMLDVKIKYTKNYDLYAGPNI